MKKEKPVMLLAFGGKFLAVLARELVPFVLSVLVRDGLRKVFKKKSPSASEDKSSVSDPG